MHTDWTLTLPDELLLHIFRLLPAKELLVCERVSRQWRLIARDPSLWESYSRGIPWDKPADMGSRQWSVLWVRADRRVQDVSWRGEVGFGLIVMGTGFALWGAPLLGLGIAVFGCILSLYKGGVPLAVEPIRCVGDGPKSQLARDLVRSLHVFKSLSRAQPEALRTHSQLLDALRRHIHRLQGQLGVNLATIQRF